MEALATGIALELERGLGYQSGYKTAAKLANLNNLADAGSQQSWIVADVKTGLLRSHNAPQLFANYPREMVEIFTDPDKHDGDITSEDFSRGHAWRKAVNLSKRKPLTGSLEDFGKHYVSLRDGVILTHRTSFLPKTGAAVAFHTPTKAGIPALAYTPTR